MSQLRVALCALALGCLSLPVWALNAVFEASSTAVLGNPHDIKLSPDGRYLLVSDVGNNRVTLLDPESLQQLGHFGREHQSGTHDVDFDREGLAYVASTHNNKVIVYRLQDREATKVSEISGNFRGPEGVLAHPNGRLYIAGAWSGNVVAFEQGKQVAELKGLSSPHDLELAADGNLWLADAGNDRLLLLTPELEIKKELSGKPYDFNGVRYLDLLADGTLITADKYTHSIKFINADGSRLLLQLGTGSPGRGENEFTTPEGVEVSGQTVWFSDSGNNRVVRYRVER